MFTSILHIGYVVGDLERGIAWFRDTFGATHAGGGTMAPSWMFSNGGRNAFVRFSGVEAELMEPAASPAGAGGVAKDAMAIHHVGYVVDDIAEAVRRAKAKGLAFLADAASTNPMGQQVLYFDPATTNGVLMHLTQIPPAGAPAPASGPKIERILHAGYLVRDAASAAAWYVDKFDGTLAGIGASRRGGRAAFVDFGHVQVELIEPPDVSALGSGHVLDHVGYQVRDITGDMGVYRARGQRFQTEAPTVNPIGQQVLYFDTATSLNSRMHLTQLPG